MRLIEILENRKEALKVSEVAKILGVTPQHIYKMAKAGLIPCFHVQGAIRFCPADLAEWIKKEIEQSNQARNGSNGRNDMNYRT
jgi:excisionase family DNA binding protein